jgi:serpin B
VSDKTNGKIETLFDRLEAADVVVLANAVYFKGRWTEEFDKGKTWDQEFHRADGSAKQHPMMRQGGEYRYWQGEGLEMISLPYGEERFEMLVLLPGQDGAGLAGLVGRLSPDNLGRWLDSTRMRDGNIVLPKFKHRCEKTLNEPLAGLGMDIAFDPARADFNGMLPAPIDMPFFISEVLHKTFVEVNEEGTEAAAVTGVKMALTAMPTEERFQMVCDHPFVYLIRDRETGAVLFVGTVLDPKV